MVCILECVPSKYSLEVVLCVFRFGGKEYKLCSFHLFLFEHLSGHVAYS